MSVWHAFIVCRDIILPVLFKQLCVGFAFEPFLLLISFGNICFPQVLESWFRTALLTSQSSLCCCFCGMLQKHGGVLRFRILVPLLHFYLDVSSFGSIIPVLITFFSASSSYSTMCSTVLEGSLAWRVPEI